MAAWDDLGITADPGRVHTEGRIVRAALEEAREQVAALVGVRGRQVVLTSGGTEAVNSAVWGVLAPHDGDPGPRPVACADVEHSAVRDASARLGTLLEIGVDGVGRITAAAAISAEATSSLTGRMCLKDHLLQYNERSHIWPKHQAKKHQATI